jgi:hypothetical protein
VGEKSLISKFNLFMETEKMKKIFIYGFTCIGFIGVGLFATTESASAASWYNPIWYNPNIECQNGYAYGPTNLKNGKCRVNWNGVVDSVITGSIDSALHGFTGH